MKVSPSGADLRAFIRDELEGQLFDPLFNKTGRAFAVYYYGENDSPYFPCDIDDYALRYFGPSRYHSNEFQQEAYLFIPFDEGTLVPSALANAMMTYLDCECTYFPSMKDDAPIMSAYSYARRLGVREGFLPLLVKVDETLWECLIMNSAPASEGEDDYGSNPEKVAEYRKKMLAAPMKDGKAVLKELIDQRKDEADDDDRDWEEEVLGEMKGGYDNCRFSSYWDSDIDMPHPLILAKIPVENPWEVLAHLSFGNWNECLDTPELMSVTKYWFEQCGAIPAAMTHDELEFNLSAPVPKEKASEVTVEQYGFCPDMDQNFEELGALADTLRRSTIWYFWWD